MLGSNPGLLRLLTRSHATQLDLIKGEFYMATFVNKTLDRTEMNKAWNLYAELFILCEYGVEGVPRGAQLGQRFYRLRRSTG